MGDERARRHRVVPHQGRASVRPDRAGHLEREGGALNLVISIAGPVVVFRTKVMDLPPHNREALYETMLRLNTSEMVHGAFGIEDDLVVIAERARAREHGLQRILRRGRRLRVGGGETLPHTFEVQTRRLTVDEPPPGTAHHGNLFPSRDAHQVEHQRPHQQGRRSREDAEPGRCSTCSSSWSRRRSRSPSRSPTRSAAEAVTSRRPTRRRSGSARR